MKSEQLKKIVNIEVFWWHYIIQCEAGNRDFAAAVIAYQREYLSEGKTFERVNTNESDSLYST